MKINNKILNFTGLKTILLYATGNFTLAPFIVLVFDFFFTVI